MNKRWKFWSIVIVLFSGSFNISNLLANVSDMTSAVKITLDPQTLQTLTFEYDGKKNKFFSRELSEFHKILENRKDAIQKLRFIQPITIVATPSQTAQGDTFWKTEFRCNIESSSLPKWEDNSQMRIDIWVSNASGKEEGIEYPGTNSTTGSSIYTSNADGPDASIQKLIKSFADSTDRCISEGEKSIDRDLSKISTWLEERYPERTIDSYQSSPQPSSTPASNFSPAPQISQTKIIPEAASTARTSRGNSVVTSSTSDTFVVEMTDVTSSPATIVPTSERHVKSDNSKSRRDRSHRPRSTRDI